MDNTTYRSIKDSQRRMKTAKSTIYKQVKKSNPNITEEKAQIIADGIEHFSFMERYAEKQITFPEVREYAVKHFDIHSGYLCTFSENYMLRRSGTIETDLPDEELIRDLFFGLDTTTDWKIRDLAESFRNDNDVKLSVEAWMQSHVRDAQTRQSYKNILERARFLTDAQMIQYWRIIIGGICEESKRQSNTDE